MARLTRNTISADRDLHQAHELLELAAHKTRLQAPHVSGQIHEALELLESAMADFDELVPPPRQPTCEDCTEQP